MRATLALALAVLAPACKHAGSAPEEGGREPTHDERMAWWREARFGMFVHWGLYAIPAGAWPEDAPASREHGEWIRDSARIPVGEYEGLRARFDPVRFDADLWARTAKDAGMEYLVITSKHHDGFALFDSEATTWDVAASPFRRDVLAELAPACERNGVRFATYHSILDWHHPDYLPRRGWERADRPEGDARFDRYERYLHGQVEEIVTRYRPAVMWFDGEWEESWSHERGVRLFELCRRLDPWMIVNNRVDVHRGGMGGFSSSSEAVGDFATPEQEIPEDAPRGVDWETCMTMNDHWGFCAADDRWKSTQDLVRKLADVASKGGNFLLNVGPRADGTFPPEAIERLAAIGAWMRANGESIRGTSASPFDALAFGRCTVRDGEGRSRLYLHVFEAPADGKLVLPGLASEVSRASWLARPGTPLACARAGADVTISLDGPLPDPLDAVVVVEVDGPVVVHRAPRIESAADVLVRPIDVRIAAGAPGHEVRYDRDGGEPGPDSPVADGPIRVEDTCTITARAFERGRPVSALATASFRRVEPRPSVVVPRSLPGLRVEERAAEGWTSIGDFDALPAGSGSEGWVAERVELPFPGVPRERVALRYRGFLEAPRDDVYVLELTSDDGARLSVGGEVVVDHDGLHVATGERGRIALAAGAHPIEIVWFNRTGDAALSLAMAPLGSEPVEVRRFRRAPEETSR